MVASVSSVTFSGVDVSNIDVQVQISSGLPAFTIVGLADKAVGESKERVRAALNAIGLSLPAKRITVNLAPADQLKEGSHFDLPIAVGLLVAMEVLPAEDLSEYVILGELGLDSKTRPVAGVLPAAISANSIDKGLICPFAQGGEAVWSGLDTVLAPKSLLDLINHFKGTQLLTMPKAVDNLDEEILLDLKDIKGQEAAKRALEIVASGGHNMLMVGPPGSGKSMLASRLPSILPTLSPKESLEVSMIHSIAGKLEDGKLIRKVPYRDPHHSASTVALVGGGSKAKPGEISLAHRGVLFLDELPEYSRTTLEALRQPVESGHVSVARANSHVTYPARIQLIAAMNPCKCDYYGDVDMGCGREPKCALDYQSKISGPMYDRIGIHIDVPAVKPWDMASLSSGEESSVVRERVIKTRKIQAERYKKLDPSGKITINAHAFGDVLDKACDLDEECRQFMAEAAEKLRLSARGYHRVLRVSRTLADMECSEKISKHNIAEALSFRRVIPGKSRVSQN